MPKLYALLTFRNEMRFLPGYFKNIAPHVDGVIALDDRSTDGSTAFVDKQPLIETFLRIRPDDKREWSDSRNHSFLYHAAHNAGVDWALGLDADERLEKTFRERAETEIKRAEKFGYTAYAIRLLELWGSPTTYREDGVWGRKTRARLFKPIPERKGDANLFHGQWASEASKIDGKFPLADLIFYHLRMIQEKDRVARVEKWKALDPNNKSQPMGYDYMLDEAGLRLKSLPIGRGYAPLHETP